MGTHMIEFDQETTRKIERTYMSKDVSEQRGEVIRLLQLQAGELVLDIGSGPGFLATEMAEAVRGGGEVIGVDNSESMLSFARSHADSLGLEGRVAFVHGDANELPVPEESFDVAVSTQVFEYLEDVDAALGEVFRVLRPGGRFLVLDTDWDSLVWNASDPDRTAEILRVWDQHLADPHLPRTLKRHLLHAGFEVEGPRVIPIVSTDFRPDTYGWGLGEIIADYVNGRDGLTDADVSEWLEDLKGLAEVGNYFLSINRYVFIGVKRSLPK